MRLRDATPLKPGSVAHGVQQAQIRIGSVDSDAL